MTTIKSSLKKVLTIKGFLHLMLVIFILNMTRIGKTFLSTIKTYLARGLSGMGKF